jgi:hypothetical protein
MDCIFSQPQNYQGNPPNNHEAFAFAHMTCNTSEAENVSNGTANFYISKQLDYGQILILTFLLLFFVFGTIKFLWNYIYQHESQKI